MFSNRDTREELLWTRYMVHAEFQAVMRVQMKVTVMFERTEYVSDTDGNDRIF
jgi:hypothetical protein